MQTELVDAERTGAVVRALPPLDFRELVADTLAAAAAVTAAAAAEAPFLCDFRRAAANFDAAERALRLAASASPWRASERVSAPQ